MYDTILFPTDGSEGATVAREHALDLAADQSATLHVLHVVEATAPVASLHEMVADQLRERGHEIVDAVADEGRERGVDVETSVVEGDPANAIAEYAMDEGIDVIVMPTHGRAELAKTLIGSVTDKVVRTGPVPVIVLKSETLS